MDEKSKNHKVDETAVIETKEDLEVLYPRLVAKVRDEMVEKIGMFTAKQVKEKLPESAGFGWSLMV